MALPPGVEPKILFKGTKGKIINLMGNLEGENAKFKWAKTKFKMSKD